MNTVRDSANIHIRLLHRFLLYKSLEKGEWPLSRLGETLKLLQDHVQVSGGHFYIYAPDKVFALW